MSALLLKRYSFAFREYKWLGLATFILTLGSAGIFTFFQEKPTYKGEGVLRYNNSLVIITKTGNDLQQQQQQQQGELTKEMLLDPRVILAVAQKFNIPEKIVKRATEIRLPRTGEITQFKVYYQSADKTEAETITNALMEEMVKNSQYINTAKQRELIKALKKRLPKILAELREAERAQEKYEKQESTSILAFKSNILPQSIAFNEDQERQLKLNLQATEAQINSIEKQLGLNTAQALVAQALAADPIIGNLRQQLFEIESKLAIARKELWDKHPEIENLINQQQAYEKQLQERAAEVLGGAGIAAPLREASQIRVDASLDPVRQELAKNLITLQTQKESLAQQLIGVQETKEQLRNIYDNLPNKQLELSRLIGDVKLKQAFFDRVQASLVDAQTAEVETLSSLTIAQPAFVPSPPPPKSKILILGAGGISGIVLGLGVIFILGMFGGKFYTWEDVRTALSDQDVPLLGLLPQSREVSKHKNILPLLIESSSPYLPYYEKLRSNLQLIGDRPAKVVLITSADADEGKSFSAYNLAMAGARSGKRTLLIEADLRSPSAAPSVGIIPYQTTTNLPLTYYGNLSNNIRLVPEVENFYLLPTPGPIAQVATVLESSEMRQLLADVRYRFDLVIVDAPALNLCNDALLLEPYTDGMILVVRTCHTRSNSLADIIEQLTNESEESKVGPRLLGGVVNGADISLKALTTI